MVYELNVEFPMTDKWTKHSDAVNKAIRKYANSSGAGFGIRDMQFSYKTRLGAENVQKRVKKIKIPKLKTFIIERKDDE